MQVPTLYQYSWTILLAPLFSFVVITFGTRVWDLLSRPKAVVAVDGGHGTDLHSDEHASGDGDHEVDHGLEDDEDPQVPGLTLGAKASAWVGLVVIGFAAIYSWVLLFASAGASPALPAGGAEVLSYAWASFGSINYTIAFHVDQLAIAMMVVVTTVSFLVHFYSQGYMDNSAGYARFYAYLSLFTFSMLVIVFAQNFLVIFTGWELVGLSSYLLIGFWINKRAKPEEDRPAPASAAIQAFIMNRIGDVGFILGIMILFANTGTFEFAALQHGVATMDKNLLTVAMILVFCGAIGKSAQVPLQTWLPSAMEGPTPVSALIHAATMVAAGVYMVARTLPLFAAANPAALQTVAWVGAITALFAATIALVQTDFKRVLAFSTISQLGYMFVGLGVAGATDYAAGPGMFHLFTHAFFKALLFLGAGAVLHSLHHAMHREVQDMRLMGGLAKFMPITALTWLIATLAISGFPFLSGFYSKDTIIGLAFENKDYAIYAITLFTAGLTAFYMFRAYILAFGGKGGSRGGLWGNADIYRGTGTPHESPRTMTIPLILLGFASIVGGYWFGFFKYLDPKSPSLIFGTIMTDPLTWIGVVVALIGLGIAYAIYARVEMVKIQSFVENNAVLSFLHRLLLHKYYIDDLYSLFVKYVVFGIAHIAQAFDTYIVDGAVNGVARLVTSLG
ncbi:MAG TPA: NADH-quinone oxidoreductase subunit L, partial [Ktedonobacteraceae bacterium]|nr:NADH-quinone oxidoreductase subunit L [Ktedonobacteraceae bacterium]